MNKTNWTVPELLKLSGDYWSACALHAGVRLDLFTPLSERVYTVEEVSALLSCNSRGVAMLLNALASINLVEKNGNEYRATGFSAEFLSKTSPAYMGYIIMHHHHLMYSWVHLADAVMNGQPVRERVSHGDDETMRENFEMGMFNLAMQLAPKIVAGIDLAGRRRLLDLGGGPGTYAIHFCRHNPELEAVVYDLETTRPFAEKTIARFALSSRVKFEAGDFETGEIHGKFDAAWLSHILHGVGPDECAAILKKATDTLEPGGMLMVQEFILDDTQDGPVFPAMFSLNMLVGTPNGQAYSGEQLFAMMEAAGARNLRRIPLDLPNGAGVIAGIVPYSFITEPF